jgi:hypothetical protein
VTAPESATNWRTLISVGRPLGDVIPKAYLSVLRRTTQLPTISFGDDDTGGTFTRVFAVSSRDHTIVDNGDGTFTDTVFSSGGSRYYDTHGNFVLKDPGQVRFAVDVNYNGTPGDPSYDVVVDVRSGSCAPSTGNSDFSGRDFCADLVEFTS